MKLFDRPPARLFSSIAVLAIFALENAQASQFHEHVIGDAFGLKNTEFLYRETHCGLENMLARQVVYQHRDGSLIARKLLDYGSGNITPSFVQHNIRANEKISVLFDQKQITMSVTGAETRAVENKYPVTASAKSPIVIDAGFDVFIRNNWDKLVSGKPQEFRFPLASRSRLVSLQVKPTVCGYETESDQCFKLEPSNWFFRMLAAPIELGYDSALRRLTRYRGLSNIDDENGKGLVVDIRYRYQSTPGLACSIEPLSLIEQAVILNPVLDLKLS